MGAHYGPARVLRALLPSAFRRFCWRAGRSLARDLTDCPQLPSIEGSLATLRRLGFDPRFCVDVGAYEGQWTATFKSIFPGSKVLMIEAQEAKRPSLQKVAASHPGDLSIRIALLGPADGETVSFTEMESGSSVFAEASPYPRTTAERTTERLDSLLARGGYPSVDFLKLDIQGYELEVLKGAPAALAQAGVVLLEASLVPINEGCPLIADVVAFMTRSGFRLFDFCSQIRRRDGVLWQTDLLFLRSDSPIVPDAALTHENWS